MNDAERIRLARTLILVFVAGFGWAALGLRTAERWCEVGSCGVEHIGLMPAWGAVAAVVAGRYGWNPGRAPRTAGLAWLTWTAWCVTFPAASELVLAGPFLASLMGLGAFGFLLHWTLIAGLQAGSMLAFERWVAGSAPAARTQ